MFIYLAVRGIRNCLKEGHDKVFLLTWMSLMVVGIGSFLFHSTLWCMLLFVSFSCYHSSLITPLFIDSMQLVDELSMISTTLIMWFATFAYGKSNAFSWVFGCGLFSSFILMASVYHHLGDPVFHQNGYAILTSIVLGRSWFLVRSHLKGKSPEDYYIMKCLFFTGLGCVATAFALWSADTQYCGTIRGWRREIGMPWGFFLEGHGHWHLYGGPSHIYIAELEPV